MQIFAPFMLKKKYRVARILALILPVIVLVALLSQTAMAQNTYVITDGEQVTVHTSFASDPARVLVEAGVELDEDDYYTTAAGDGVSEITVQRVQTVTIDNCGSIVTTTTYGETLGSLLERLGIQTYGSYTVSEGLDTMTYDGMEVTIGNVVTTQETYTVEIPVKTFSCDDPSLPLGQEKVLVEGTAGQLLRQAEVVYKNGVEQSRIVLEETVIQPPVERIVAVGTGEMLGEEEPSDRPLIGDGVIVLPTGEVLTYTHSDSYKGTAYTHGDEGVDFITATGTTVHRGTVAVDPTLIPYGTRMFIVTEDGEYIYGLSTAEDCGGGVKGKHVDLYFESASACFAFGVRQCTIYFLGESQIW